MSQPSRSYLPAAGFHWTLPLYDPLVKLLGGDAARAALLDQAALRVNERVLDIGCGTGTLAMTIKRRYPQVEVTGLDPDPGALARAARKAQRASLSIQLDRGFSDDLPYEDARFERVFSSFMLHHLDDKEATLREVRRVLKPGGAFHMLDFAEPRSGGVHGRLSHLVHSSKRLKDNNEARMLELMQQAGLVSPMTVAERSLLVGHIAYYQALAPS